MIKRFIVFAFAFAVATGSAVGPSRADIYKYTDKSGVVHFTNVPTTPQYRLYQKNNHAADDDSESEKPVTFRFFSGGDETRLKLRGLRMVEPATKCFEGDRHGKTRTGCGLMRKEESRGTARPRRAGLRR